MTETTVFIDTIETVDDNSAPTKIEREFITLTGGYDQELTGLPDEMEGPEPIELASELEGQKAIFDWDAEGDQWIASATEDADYDEEVLEELEQNASLPSSSLKSKLPSTIRGISKARISVD